MDEISARIEKSIDNTKGPSDLLALLSFREIIANVHRIAHFALVLRATTGMLLYSNHKFQHSLGGPSPGVREASVWK
jgi:hypothetical protein